jgi:hypothetical protein
MSRERTHTSVPGSEKTSINFNELNVAIHERHTRHSNAVNIIWVASRLWIKLGGNADACFIELTIQVILISTHSSDNNDLALPSAGEFGSEIYTVCTDVMICFLFDFLYGCTIGKPKPVVHTTLVICSFFNRVNGSRLRPFFVR